MPFHHPWGLVMVLHVISSQTSASCILGALHPCMPGVIDIVCRSHDLSSCVWLQAYQVVGENMCKHQQAFLLP